MNYEEINKNIIINEERINNDERLKRIKKLIIKNVSNKDYEDFPESNLLEINSNKIQDIKEPIKLEEITIDNYEFNEI